MLTKGQKVTILTGLEEHQGRFIKSIKEWEQYFLAIDEDNNPNSISYIPVCNITKLIADESENVLTTVGIIDEQGDLAKSYKKIFSIPEEVKVVKEPEVEIPKDFSQQLRAKGLVDLVAERNIAIKAELSKNMRNVDRRFPEVSYGLPSFLQHTKK